MRISDWNSDVCSSDLRLDGAGEDLEQRRLAAAVDADDAQAVTCGYGHRQVGEERLAWPAHGHTRGVDEDHRGMVPDAARPARMPTPRTGAPKAAGTPPHGDRKSTRLNSSH